MMNYDYADIVLVLFLQSNGSRKQRPALVILDTGDDDIVLAPITSQKCVYDGNLGIKDWKHAGLLTTSWVRLTKVACVSKGDIAHKLGRMSTNDAKNVVSVWNRLYIFKSK